MVPRAPNVMLRKRCEEGGRVAYDVRFIDFDWSGAAGHGVYPSRMNSDITWHTDAQPGRPLQQEHDLHLLDQDFR